MLNIYYRNNIITNCEQSFEYWSHGTETSHIYFEHNTCLNAGYDWAHNQRTTCARGCHILFCLNDADIDNFFIRNNIFCESTEQAIYMAFLTYNYSSITIDNNLYYDYSCPFPDTKEMVYWRRNRYSYTDTGFSDYQTDTGNDSTSIIVDPTFVDYTNEDLHLQSTSSAIDIGIASSMVGDGDFNGNVRLHGVTYDLGAYEQNYTPLTDGLVAYWKLDTNDNACALDSYGIFKGDINGTQEEEGKVGGALDFNGTSDYVSIPTMNYDEITVSAWFYKDTNDSIRYDAIFGGWYYNSNVLLQEGFELTFPSSSPDRLSFVLVTENSSGVRTKQSCVYDFGSENSVSDWHHVVATYKKSTGIQTLYIDGNSVSTKTHTAGNTIVPLTYYSDMRIGYSRVNVGYFNGLIDDVRVYNRALTATEASDLYEKSHDMNLSSSTVLSYCSAQDVTSAQHEIADSGKTLHLWGNNWKAISCSQTISADTVLEFDFKCTTEGEIHGIGLETQISSITGTRQFQITGTQNWGVQTYNDGRYTGSDWKHYVIPIGKHYTGSFNYITFINDDDGSASGDVYFKNIRVYTP